MRKLNKKGFTLTEMIVVIAIIGILAAVMIPGVVIYVQRAQKSNDEQLAASMTDEIERYCIMNDIDQDELLGTDIRTILSFKDYDLTPSRDKWTYVYNVESRTVELSSPVVDSSHDFLDPTNFREGYYLLGTGDSELEQVVYALCNMSDLSVYAIANRNAESAGAKALLRAFDPAHTLYISNTRVHAQNGVTEFSKVVFAEKTVHIPSLLGSNLSLIPSSSNFSIESFKTPAVLKTIDKDSELTSYFPNLKEVDEKSVIDLSEYYKDDAEDLVTGDKQYIPAHYQLGEHYEEATAVVIETFPIGNDLYNANYEYHIFRVSYFNENGLFARCSTIISNNTSDSNQ